MPNSCDATDLVTAAACFKDACLGETDRLGLLIYLMALEADQVNSTSFADDVDALQAAIAPLQPLSASDLQAADIAVASENATTAGASVPGTVSEMMTASVAFRNMRFQQLAITYLRCAIGS